VTRAAVTHAAATHAAARRLSWFSLCCIIASALIGCGDDGGRNCVPGTTRECTGPAECAGAQACAADGSGYGACECSENRALSTEANRLGQTCERDSDCGAPFVCWSAAATAFLGNPGGAAHGYCTVACTTLADCTSIDPLAACSSASVVSSAAPGACVRGCLSKDPAPGERKCLDRLDVACWSDAALGQPFSPTTRQAGNCLPACGSDADCAGRRCDLGSGRCVDGAASGAELGTPCVADAECASGSCVARDGGPSVCSANCRLGSLACGFAEAATNRGAVCAIPEFSGIGGAEGVGDLGVCLAVCGTDNICPSPGYECTGRAAFLRYCELPAQATTDEGANP
jgi:hypothetical protein